MATAVFIQEALPLLRAAWTAYTQGNPLTANMLTAAPPTIPTSGELSPALRAQIIGLVSSHPNQSLTSPTTGFTWSQVGTFHGLVIFQGSTLVWVAALDAPITLESGESRTIETAYLTI